MIVRTGDADRFVAKPPKTLRAALLYGPDQGLVRERADVLIRTVCADPRDPFRVAELDESEIASDPARLADEVAALSMTGGRRVVRIRPAGNALASRFEAFLDASDEGALVVAEAGDLAKGSALREIFEEAEDAAAIACYPDSPEQLSDLLRRALKAEGVAISDEALEEAVSLLGADRALARREVDKLATYARGLTRLELSHIRALMGDETEARAEEACDAAGEGHCENLDRALERLWAAGTSPVPVVRAGIGHFQRLALAKADSTDAALRRRPPLHFSRTASFRAQVSRWSASRLEEALDLLLETEALCKTTAVPAEAVCSRAFFTVAAWARLRD